MERRLLLVCAIVLLGFAAPSFAGPPQAWTENNGKNVTVLFNTDEVQYTCTYTITATFADGTTGTYSGQTDPTIKAQNHRAGGASFAKDVKSSTVQTNCKAKG